MEWIRETLGEICQKGGGKIQTGPFGSQLHESDYSLDGIPVVMPADIIGGMISTDRIARVSENHVERLRRHKLSTGDIVYGRRGNIGRQALVREENSGWLCGTGCLKISLGNAKLSHEYLHSYLATSAVIGWIQGQSVGATLPNLNTGILERIPVIYPKKIEIQEKIASILSSYDDLIENKKRCINLLEKMAEEIYREWFVRFRFPGHENMKFEKGVPEGWDWVKIEKAFQFTGGGTPSKNVPSYWEIGSINWFTPSDITSTGSLFLQSSENKCSQEGLSNSSARLFPAYSIMMTSRATIGALGINTTPACTNQGFITCIPNERYPLTFLYHWLKLSKPYFEVLSSGATFSELTKGTFKKIKILTPPQETVSEYEKVVFPIFTQIEILLKKNKVLEKARDLLLPRLISGKLSVENLDIQFPPSMEEEVHEA